MGGCLGLNKVLTDDEYEHSSQHYAFVFGALGFLAQADAGHGHQERHHRQETQYRSSDHQGSSGLDVGCRDIYVMTELKQPSSEDEDEDEERNKERKRTMQELRNPEDPPGSSRICVRETQW